MSGMAIEFSPHNEQRPFTVVVAPSLIIELDRAAHFLLDDSHHHANQSWVDNVLSEANPTILESISFFKQGNFPLIGLGDLYDICLHDDGSEDRIVDALELLKQSTANDIALAMFNEQVLQEQLETVQNNPARFHEFYQSLPWASSGTQEFVNALVFQSEQVKQKCIDFLSFLQPFVEKEYAKQLPAMNAAIPFINNQLKTKHPLDLAQEIKGSHYHKSDFNLYRFVPSYFSESHNFYGIRQHRFLMIFNLTQKFHEEHPDTQKLADDLKVLSDPKRLEIIRMISRRPTFAKVLAARLNLTTATVSRHVELLKAADLIRETKKDRVKYLSLNDENFRLLMGRVNRFVWRETE
jgi:DNA-binding transcriptional ArsR family regulator